VRPVYAGAIGRLPQIYVCPGGTTPAKSVICSESFAASTVAGPAARVWAVRSRSSKAIRSLQAAWAKWFLARRTIGEQVEMLARMLEVLLDRF